MKMFLISSAAALALAVVFGLPAYQDWVPDCMLLYLFYEFLSRRSFFVVAFCGFELIWRLFLTDIVPDLPGLLSSGLETGLQRRFVSKSLLKILGALRIPRVFGCALETVRALALGPRLLDCSRVARVQGFSDLVPLVFNDICVIFSLGALLVGSRLFYCCFDLLLRFMWCDLSSGVP